MFNNMFKLHIVHTRNVSDSVPLEMNYRGSWDKFDDFNIVTNNHRKHGVKLSQVATKKTLYLNSYYKFAKYNFVLLLNPYTDILNKNQGDKTYRVQY